MSKQDTAEQLYSKLGILNPTLRSNLKQSFIEFLKKETKSENPLSRLDNSEIEKYTSDFLDSEEGAECLTRCSTDSEWQRFSGLAKGKLYRLAKVWAKGQKKRKLFHTDSAVQVGEKRPNSMSNALTSGPATEDPELPPSSSRLTACEIDRREYKDETGLQDNISECTTDDLASISELIAKGKRKQTVKPEPERLWSPDSNRTRERTEEAEVAVAQTPFRESSTLLQGSSSGMLSPPATRPRSVRTREEDSNDYSPATVRPVKRTRYVDEDSVQLQQAGRDKGISSSCPIDLERDDGFPAGRNEDSAEPPISRTLRSPMPIYTSKTQATEPSSSSVLISLQEAQFTHENLVKIPSTILSYIRHCEKKINRTYRHGTQSREQMRMQRARSLLLNHLAADIEDRILSMSDRNSEDDDPEPHSYVLQEYT